MRIAIAFYACAAYAWLPPTPLHCTRARARPAAQSDAAEDESIGRRRFVDVLDIEPRQPSATEANRRWDASFPTWLVSLALLGPLEWLIIAPVLGFLPAKDMSPDLVRGLIATVALFFVVRDTDETPLRAAVALPLSPLRLTIDDEQLPVPVWKSTGELGYRTSTPSIRRSNEIIVASMAWNLDAIERKASDLISNTGPCGSRGATTRTA